MALPPSIQGPPGSRPSRRLGVIPETSLSPVNTTDLTTDRALEQTSEGVGDVDHEPTLTLDLALSEAEALRTWLLKPAQDGTTSLDDPLVSRALTKLGTAIDTVLATVNVRRELQQAGLAIDHLSDEQVCDLGRRVTQAATPGIRN
jgi:hypothetical protein